MDDTKNDGSIFFYPILAKITGSITTGLFLSHLINWNVKKDQGCWFSKTINEIEEETTLSQREQETAIKKLKELNLIDYKVKGLPAKRYFKINFEILFKLVKDYKNKCENCLINQ